MSSPNDDLKLTVDKFIFRFPKELRYSESGLWIRKEDGLLRIGLSDFAQQRNGDIAFATLLPAGTVLDAGDEIAAIETVKVNISLPSPVKGKVVEINASLHESPELMNQDPYGNGWIAVIQPENHDRDLSALMTAEAYLTLAWQQAEAELMS
jgi:glycine cleavage system H protein